MMKRNRPDAEAAGNEALAPLGRQPCLGPRPDSKATDLSEYTTCLFRPSGRYVHTL